MAGFQRREPSESKSSVCGHTILEKSSLFERKDLE